MNITIINKDFKESEYEFVERKGKGHPDSLSDNLAEFLSAKYSQYTKKNFGAILHHNFDKVGLLGGASDVGFGYGQLTKPIRVLLNGRSSTKFGDTNIDVRGLLLEWTKEFMSKNLPLTNPDTELEFHYNQSNQSSPGKTEEHDNKKKSARKYWFEPRDLNDIPELKNLVSNDTSMGVGFAPYSVLEILVLEIEKTLNSSDFKKANVWIGSDIKIMGFRHKRDFKITMCIPQIGKHVNSIDEYKSNILFCRGVVEKIVKKYSVNNLELNINTRDDYEKGELYLTAIGSSIESGDEGLVGRGNRIQGFISPTRLMSMEGAAGKNPVYHIGKIYYIASQQISEKIYEELNIPNEVVLISQSGRALLDPWVIFIHVPEEFKDVGNLENIIKLEIQKIPEITDRVINFKIDIC
jgi:S-adenosylmethionine synthetase